MSSRRVRSGLGALGVATALAAGVTGCSLPDVTMSPRISGHPSAAAAAPGSAAPATHAAAATSSAAGTPARAAGDLDSGSVTHSLPAGNRTVVIDYWTTKAATQWTAADTKTFQLSAHLEGGTAATKITRFGATVDDGRTRTTAVDDRGEFAFTPPFTYSTALNLAPSPSSVTGLTVYVQLDLLVETEPGSDQFFRQTVLDPLRLPLLEEGPQ